MSAVKCPTGKKAFSTWHGAQRIVVNAKIQRLWHHSTKRREDRAYVCPVCGYWHVTSKPDRMQEADR